MKLHKPWMIRLGARVGARVIRLWMGTVRCKVDSLGQQTDPWDPAMQERYLYSLWHENLLGVFAFRSAAPVTMLVSQSADGDFLSQMIESYGVQPVRGSSSRGGIEAVDQVLALNRQAHVVVAPDGPRGPRREVKRGLIYLSAWTKLPIVPLGMAFRRAWHVNSWDRMAIPKPGTLLCVVGGPVITVPQGLGKRAMEEYRLLTERSMMTATAVAEAWAQGRTPAAQWPDSSAAAA